MHRKKKNYVFVTWNKNKTATDQQWLKIKSDRDKRLAEKLMAKSGIKEESINSKA